MKKVITLLLVTLFLTSDQTTTYAKETTDFIPLSVSTCEYNNETVIFADENITITESLTFGEKYSGVQTLSTKKYVSPTIIYNVKSSTGRVLATYTLKATFTYNGKTAACTKSSYSTQIKSKNLSFTSTSAGKSENTATGKYSLKIKNTGRTITYSISIKCDKNGNIY